MRFKYLILLFISLAMLTNTVRAESFAFKPFSTGSYAQLLTSKAGKPFMLAVWSITCPSCIKDMTVLSAVHQAHPELTIIMLSTDDISSAAGAEKILASKQLTKLENWIYAADNTQALQFEMDPKWYGELPRTYFFAKNHQRVAVSGALSKEEYEAHISKILQ